MGDKFNMKIRSKLFLLTGILIAGFVIYGLISYFLLETIKIKGPYYEKIIESKDIIADILPPPGYIIEFYLLTYQEKDETNPAKLNELIKRSQKLMDEYNQTHDKWAKALPEGRLKDVFVYQSNASVQDIFNIWKDQFIPAITQGNGTATQSALDEISKKYQEHRALIDEVVKMATANNEQLEATVNEIYNRNRLYSSLAWVATLLLGITIGYLLARSIDRMLHRAVGGLVPISNEISLRLDQQGKAIAQQSSSVHQTTSAMDELNTSFQHTEGLVQESSNRAKTVLQIAETGNNLLKQVISSLSTHREKVTGIVDQILRLSELTRQIHNIAAVTSNLTNQTNILALNAAVQAAHVKQQSEGFSVIASEIRKLADESKKFLSHIDVLAENIQIATDATVTIAEEGNRTIQELIKQSQETAQAFNSLISITNKSFEGAEQASLNVKQQGIAVHQVLEAMENLNDVSKQSLAEMQQVRNELVKLNTIIRDLQSSI